MLVPILFFIFLCSHLGCERRSSAAAVVVERRKVAVDGAAVNC